MRKTKTKKTRPEIAKSETSSTNKGWLDVNQPIRSLRESPLKFPGWVAVLLLIGITLSLGLTGIRWGLPNDRPWNTDSISGIKTVRMIPQLFSSWRMADRQGNALRDRQGKLVIERYPRMQFLITGSLYKPFIEHWKKHPVEMRHPQTGKMVKTLYDQDRISTLILLSRLVSVLMAVGAVLGVFATTRQLCRDSLPGFLAALVLAFSAIFTFLSHLGNLDVPVTFWFVWTGYWVVRALQTGKMRYFLLMGLFAGLVVCTKDPSAGHLGGLALFTFVVMGIAQYRRKKSVGQAMKLLGGGPLWIALGTFLLVFLLLNNVLTDFEAFKTRIEHWMGIKDLYVGSAGKQWNLFLQAIFCLRECCGVWVFSALGACLMYCLWRYPLLSLWAIGPFLIFHLTVTMGAYQVQPRYHLPSLACLSIVVGLAGRDFLSIKRVPLFVRLLPLVLVLGLEAIFAIGVSAEMVSESRIRAEGWIRDNLNKQKDSITFISPPSYMPRSQHEGYRVLYTHNIKKTTEQSIQHSPKYLGLSAKWFRDKRCFDQTFRKKLLGEKLGYRKIAEFGSRFLPPGAQGLFGIASMKTRTRRILSPRVVFMERIDQNPSMEQDNL